MEARALDGAHQPEVAAVLGFSASWRYSSRLTGSVGLASNGLLKRATCPPRHWVHAGEKVISHLVRLELFNALIRA